MKKLLALTLVLAACATGQERDLVTGRVDLDRSFVDELLAFPADSGREDIRIERVSSED